jgi:hypothetical protein
MNSAVIAMHGRMTEADYDRERAKIAPTKREAQQQGGIRWEQELAALFYRSGWTQEQLAEKEKKSRPYIGQLMQFGRFLAFADASANAENLPNNLSISRFRHYFDRTERGNGNERIRFKATLEMMRSETVLSRSHVKLNHGLEIKKQFANGKWHAAETIAEAIDAPKDQVERTLDLMWQRGTYNTKTERKKVGAGFHYRIFDQDQDRTVSLAELIEKLTPIIQELEAEGQKHIARSVPITCAQCAVRLQRLLESWAE